MLLPTARMQVQAPHGLTSNFPEPLTAVQGQGDLSKYMRGAECSGMMHGVHGHAMHKA